MTGTQPLGLQAGRRRPPLPIRSPGRGSQPGRGPWRPAEGLSRPASSQGQLPGGTAAVWWEGRAFLRQFVRGSAMLTAWGTPPHRPPGHVLPGHPAGPVLCGGTRKGCPRVARGPPRLLAGRTSVQLGRRCELPGPCADRPCPGCAEGAGGRRVGRGQATASCFPVCSGAERRAVGLLLTSGGTAWPSPHRPSRGLPTPCRDHPPAQGAHHSLGPRPWSPCWAGRTCWRHRPHWFAQ